MTLIITHCCLLIQLAAISLFSPKFDSDFRPLIKTDQTIIQSQELDVSGFCFGKTVTHDSDIFQLTTKVKEICKLVKKKNPFFSPDRNCA